MKKTHTYMYTMKAQRIIDSTKTITNLYYLKCICEHFPDSQLQKTIQSFTKKISVKEIFHTYFPSSNKTDLNFQSSYTNQVGNDLHSKDSFPFISSHYPDHDLFHREVTIDPFITFNHLAYIYGEMPEIYGKELFDLLHESTLVAQEFSTISPLYPSFVALCGIRIGNSFDWGNATQVDSTVYSSYFWDSFQESLKNFLRSAFNVITLNEFLFLLYYAHCAFAKPVNATDSFSSTLSEHLSTHVSIRTTIWLSFLSQITFLILNVSSSMQHLMLWLLHSIRPVPLKYSDYILCRFSSLPPVMALPFHLQILEVDLFETLENHLLKQSNDHISLVTDFLAIIAWGVSIGYPTLPLMVHCSWRLWNSSQLLIHPFLSQGNLLDNSSDFFYSSTLYIELRQISELAIKFLKDDSLSIPENLSSSFREMKSITVFYALLRHKNQEKNNIPCKNTLNDFMAAIEWVYCKWSFGKGDLTDNSEQEMMPPPSFSVNERIIKWRLVLLTIIELLTSTLFLSDSTLQNVISYEDTEGSLYTKRLQEFFEMINSCSQLIHLYSARLIQLCLTLVRHFPSYRQLNEFYVFIVTHYPPPSMYTIRAWKSSELRLFLHWMKYMSATDYSNEAETRITEYASALSHYFNSSPLSELPVLASILAEIPMTHSKILPDLWDIAAKRWDISSNSNTKETISSTHPVFSLSHATLFLQSMVASIHDKNPPKLCQHLASFFRFHLYTAPRFLSAHITSIRYLAELGYNDVDWFLETTKEIIRKKNATDKTLYAHLFYALCLVISKNFTKHPQDFQIEKIGTDLKIQLLLPLCQRVLGLLCSDSSGLFNSSRPIHFPSSPSLSAYRTFSPPILLLVVKGLAKAKLTRLGIQLLPQWLTYIATADRVSTTKTWVILGRYLRFLHLPYNHLWLKAMSQAICNDKGIISHPYLLITGVGVLLERGEKELMPTMLLANFVKEVKYFLSKDIYEPANDIHLWIIGLSVLSENSRDKMDYSLETSTQSSVTTTMNKERILDDNISTEQSGNSVIVGTKCLTLPAAWAYMGDDYKRLLKIEHRTDMVFICGVEISLILLMRHANNILTGLHEIQMVFSLLLALICIGGSRIIEILPATPLYKTALSHIAYLKNNKGLHEFIRNLNKS